MDIEKIFKANMNRQVQCTEHICTKRKDSVHRFFPNGTISDQRTAHDCGYETDRL